MVNEDYQCRLVLITAMAKMNFVWMCNFSKESHNSGLQTNYHSYIDVFVNVDKHNMNEMLINGQK